jgi:aspartate carbamoyltransferase regulatory subunit
MQQIYDNLQNWKENNMALVFTNNFDKKGRVKLTSIQLSKKPLNKLAVLIPFWKRHEITDFVFNYYKNIKTQLKNEVDIILICVGSEGKMSEKIATKNKFNYIEYSNDSIQLKHDALYKYAKSFAPDACLKIDSDSLVSIDFFRYWNKLVDFGCDYSDVLDIYFGFQNCVCYWGGYDGKRKGEGTGVGRFTSARLLDMIDWQIIGEDKNSVLIDSYMTKRISTLDIIRHQTSCLNLNAEILELKSECQLTNLANIKYDNLLHNSFSFSLTNIEKYLSFYSFKNNERCAVSVIIPTMWKSNHILNMLELYNNNDFVSEVIIIDNNPDNRFDLSRFKKHKVFTKGQNIYVNPAWNWGVSLAKESCIILANDDILFNENDFNILLSKCSLFLTDDMIVGVSDKCYKQKGLVLSELNFKPVIKRNWGFGTFMIMKRNSYITIPDDLLIWCGDDIQFENNDAYVFEGIEITTKMSTTIVSQGLRGIAKADVERAKKYNFKLLNK